MDAGNVRVIHHGQGLAFGLEAGDDLLRIHARLDDLQGDLATHGSGLFGNVNDAHAPLADLLHQLVGADHRAGALGERRQIRGPGSICRARYDGGPIEQALGAFVGFDQGLHSTMQLAIPRAGLVQNADRCSGEPIATASRKMSFALAG